MAALNLPQHDITAVLPCMHVYPEPAAVFAAAELAQASRHFLPIVSIDLAAIDPAWAGRNHLVQPCENSFEWGEGYFNDWVQPNWLAFRLTEDNHYEWLGDWRCFLLEQPVPDKLPRTWRVTADDFAWVDAQLAVFGVPTPDRAQRTAQGALACTARDLMQATYDLQHASHALARQRWQSSGLLNHKPDLGREPKVDDGVSWLDQLGGDGWPRHRNHRRHGRRRRVGRRSGRLPGDARRQALSLHRGDHGLPPLRIWRRCGAAVF